MGNIFKGQTAVTFTVTVGQNISGATVHTINYRKPDGTTGYFNASISDATNGILTYGPSLASELDQAGEWVFWGQITFADGKSAQGEFYRLMIYDTIS